MEGHYSICHNAQFKIFLFPHTRKLRLCDLAQSPDKIQRLSTNELKEIIKITLNQIDEFEKNNVSCDTEEAYTHLATISQFIKDANWNQKDAKIIDDALLDRALDYVIRSKLDRAKEIYQILASSCSRRDHPNAEVELIYNHLDVTSLHHLDTCEHTDNMYKAAKSGRRVAQFCYAQLLENGTDGLEQDPVKAIKYYKKSAKQKYLPAIDRLDGITDHCKKKVGLELKYCNGFGTPQDPSTALHLTGLAMKNADIRAQLSTRTNSSL